MKIILLRHGTRNFGLGDVPLNSVGEQEAEALVEELMSYNIKKILSSPKLRCQMTVAPLAHRLACELETMADLDQHGYNEEFADYRRRVQRATDKLVEFANSVGNILACSHSDWLAQAMELIPSDITHPETIMLQCAEYIVFKIKEGQWRRI